MKVVVGLGNPGRRYEATWHNLGFMLVDNLLERAGGRAWRNEAEAKVARVELAGQPVLLVKPQTFMNLSGNAVRPLLERYGEADPANLIVALDDVALPIGMIRVRTCGSAGGQKGLQSIIDRLGTDRFARIRLGIKPDHPIDDLTSFVLERVPDSYRERVSEMVERGSDAVMVMLAEGAHRAMALFNRRVKPATGF
jgi:PTH1 family peptidyl-tRNA hydrolase